MAKPGNPSAGKGKKKGPTKGTGGNGRRALEGRGPTPKAEDRAWHPAGKRKADLARMLNLAPTLVDRLLSLHHKSRIEQIETALAVLGKRLVVDVREAA